MCSVLGIMVSSVTSEHSQVPVTTVTHDAMLSCGNDAGLSFFLVPILRKDTEPTKENVVIKV